MIKMKVSELFSKTRRESPKDEDSINAKLLIRAGFIQKMSAGVYSYLPLAWRVVQKIVNIVREEMNAIDGQELMMPALVAKEYWQKTNRWDVDVAYKVKSEHGGEFGLGWTHEEAVTAIAQNFISSYKDLPLYVYQIQTKFRAEPRAKSGLLRGREFLMKDLYSFHRDDEDLDAYYKKVIGAYKKIIKRLDLDAKVVEAGGGAFTKEFTHEFQVLHPVGEDVIYYCVKCDFARNKEIFSDEKCPICKGEIRVSNAIEIANVFKLGAKYSEPYNLFYLNKNGGRNPVIMGSYGIGISRLLGALVEVFNDEKGIIWPESVAPFRAHLILATRDKGQGTKAEKVYKELQKAGIEVLYDDREETSAGEKFNDADLIGIPYRLVVGGKSKDKVEVKKRDSGRMRLLNLKDVLKLL